MSGSPTKKLQSLYIECLKLSCLCIISGSPKKKFKDAECLYQVFKVALYMWQEWITKDKVVKLRSLYIKYLNLRCLCIMRGLKEKVVKLRSLFIKSLKLCVLIIISVSPKTKL